MTLFLTRSDRSFGIGHLKRMIALYEHTEGDKEIWVVSENRYLARLDGFLKDIPHRILTGRTEQIIKEYLLTSRPACTVIDMRETPAKLLEPLIKAGVPIISFDDYAAGVYKSEVLLCPLPHFSDKFCNFSEIQYNPVPLPHGMEIKKALEVRERILVSFGGSDPAGLARLVISAIGDRADLEITLVEGPLADYGFAAAWPNVRVLKSPESLLPEIARHGTVFTSIGMTLLESLRLNRRVITLQPTDYHNHIAARISGILNLGTHRQINPSDIEDALEQPFPENPPVPEGFDLKSWWNGLLQRTGKNAFCPVCGSENRRALSRGPKATLFTCGKCRSSYNYYLESPESLYDEEYFGKNHQERYGTDYEEDPNIRIFARRRLSLLKKMLRTGPHAPRLLDFGSAMGIFGDEAVKNGFNAEGVEINPAARKYAAEKFNFSSFSDIEETTGRFDAVTAWFLLEHLPDPAAWLKSVRERLHDRGILALSVPSSAGLLAAWNPALYKKIRPAEHYFEPTPKALEALLSRCGYRVLKREIFGLHPGRAGLPDHAAVKTVQKMLGMGDTFELYAERRPDVRKKT